MTDTLKRLKSLDISSAGIVTFNYTDGTVSEPLLPNVNLDLGESTPSAHISMTTLNLIQTLHDEIVDLKKRVNALTKATNGLMRF